ncbi:MAG: hypothetical protein H6Q04_3091 [Acidobacteria bacterium]|jgi:ketosteroid isomerase-like protein|nr:hypothetical protein [Acidobacteriota bacterium]
MVQEAGEEQEDSKKGGGKWGKAAKISLGVFGGLSLLMGYISAAGMKESEREAEARKPIDDFFAAFNARDVEAGRKTLHFPHIQIAGGDVAILENPEDFQIDFQSLAGEGWTHVTLDSCSMRQNCDEKVHFEVQLSMHKGSESRYATFQALWIVTKRDENWGIQCRSIFPSGVLFS